MPSSTENPQQPTSNGFTGAQLYSGPSNIWSNYSHTRDRSTASISQGPTYALSGARRPPPHVLTRGPDFNENKNASGSGALAANSEAVGWGSKTNSNPWNSGAAENPSRSISESPSKARNGTMLNGAGLFDGSHAPIGAKKTAYVTPGFAEETNGFVTSFAPQKRGSQESTYNSALSSFSPESREPALPPSRQSQGSPGYTDLLRGHASNTSVPQRHTHRQSASFSVQSANQQAFNMNQQVTGELAHNLRQLGLNSNNTHASSSFNPASPAFQSNPSSQSWTVPNPPRMDPSLDLMLDPSSATQPGSLNRASAGVPLNSDYRVETNGTRGYAPASDAWSHRSSPRGPRPAEPDRRMPAQQLPAFYPPSIYGNQFAFATMNPAQFTQDMLAQYNQTLRHSFVSPYGLQTLPSGYPLAAATPGHRSSRDRHAGSTMQSGLLEEFTMGKSKRWELKDIYGHILEFCGDQSGSRLIQTKLETANSDEKDQVFRELEPNALPLMKDVFGNYVIQKLFEHGNQTQKRILADKMKGKFVALSMGMYPCRVVQKALEHILVDQQAELIRELEFEILRVMKCTHGNHVVQKIIQVVPREYIDFILNAIRGQVTVLSTHQFACRVIQRILENGTEKDKADIMAELHPSMQMLITHEYGNYVTQHVIQNGKPEDRARIIRLVMSQLLTFSNHKFASNVVEKCIERASTEQRAEIRRQLTTAGSDGTTPLQQMIKDQFGNYVIRKLLDVLMARVELTPVTEKLLGQLQGEERRLLVEDIKPQLFALRRSGSSRQIQALEKLLDDSPEDNAMNSAANSTSVATGDVNPTTPSSSATTNVNSTLTTESNSPQSSSPSSTHASAVAIDGDASKGGAAKESSEFLLNGSHPNVQNGRA
ncbi:hypothetical protein S40293_01952 [Stachybotrys chartarum IBT 40293]|nr:hypothetical protein S40293_01952 [Stachybotrys chartarum IBT 40293]